MKPNEQNLERLLKKWIKQQAVPAAELLFHWRGLGKRGDRIVINTLNRQNGWESFLIWSESESDIRKQLEEMSNSAGISEAGVLGLKSAGLISDGAESPRSKSLWLLQTVRKGASDDWDAAAALLLQNEDFFEGTLSLLELEESVEIALFLSKVLEFRPSRTQDQAIRKTLYRLRQKGIQAPEQEQQRPILVEQERSEIFLFAENRLPLWQPFFYYRSGGARGDWFFAEINEGKVFEIVQQQRDIRMNQKAMQRIADNYAGEFQNGTGVKMTFQPTPANHARYFLDQSFAFLRGADDFQTYIGKTAGEDPFTESETRAECSATDAAALLVHEYFQLWMIDEEFLDSVFKRLNQIEQGPIILPEQQRRQQKAEAMDQSLKEYFSGERRLVWALALKKAAYFLKNTDSEIASLSLGFSRQLSAGAREVQREPFLNILTERSLEFRRKQIERQEQEQKGSSLIVTPQEFEKIASSQTQSRRGKR
jgi:hypothetical protein